VTFSLYVDENRWRAHLRSVMEATPGLVPVIKGNGYGLGLVRLAQEATRLGVDTVAVGTTDELPVVREHFGGDVLVLTPAYPRPDEDPTGRVVQTVAHLDTLRAATGSRVVVEAMTSMRRHGLPSDQVGQVAGLLSGVRLEGLAFHLPMDRHGATTPRGRWPTGCGGSRPRGSRRTRRGSATSRRPTSRGCARTSRPRLSGRGSGPRCGSATVAR
jgi:alanine racemase